MDIQHEVISTINQPASGIACPQFELYPNTSGQLTGFVISDSFSAKPQIERQHMLWDVLEKKLSRDQLDHIGMIFTVTPQENSE